MYEPFVSVIMPSYNSKKFIAQSIESFRNQTYRNVELIIVDDCSNDGSWEYVQRYVEGDDKIKVFQLKKNGGAAAARNYGIKQAKGKYLAFLDSDDLWHPEKLRKQVEFMESNDYAFTFTNYKMIDEAGNDLNRHVLCPPLMVYKHLLKNTTIGCLTVMLNVEKLGPIQMPNLQPEDTALWLQLLRKGTTAYCLQEILAEYRIVQNSASSNKLKVAKKMWAVYRKSEKIPFIKSLWYFSGYATNAVKKHYL